MALDVITSISLDMQNPYSTTDMVHVNQYDSGLRVKAVLLNAGQKWEVPSGAKAVVAFKKSDNIGGFYDATDDDLSVQAVSVDSNRSIIYISLDAQTTTTPTTANQYVDMQVVFYQNGKRLSTFAFYMDVRPSVVASKDITSSWVFHILAEEIASTLTAATTPDAMREWLETNIHPGQGYPIDDTLTVPGAASDAAATGKMVTVSDQNPNTVANKVWVKKTPYEVQVPTVEELNEVKSALNNNDEANYYNYGNVNYWGNAQTMTSARTIVSQKGSVLTINGSVTDNGDFFLKLDGGDLAWYNVTAFHNRANYITLINGHRYRMRVNPISGTVVFGTGNNGLYLYEEGSNTIIASVILSNNQFISADFVWQSDNKARLGFYAKRSGVFQDYKILISIDDLTQLYVGGTEIGDAIYKNRIEIDALRENKNSIQDSFLALQNQIRYWGKPSTAGTKLVSELNGNCLSLNGTATGSSSLLLSSLDGIKYFSMASLPEVPATITLKKWHIYRLRIDTIDGNVITTKSDGILIRQEGATQNVATIILADNASVSEPFLWTWDEKAFLVFYITKDASYINWKARINIEDITETSEIIPAAKDVDAYIQTNGDIGDTVDFIPQSYKDFRYAIVECKPKDQFTILGQGGISGRAWAFTDATRKLLCRSKSDQDLKDEVIIAPENSTYLVLNSMDKIGVQQLLWKRGTKTRDCINSIKLATINPIPNGFKKPTVSYISECVPESNISTAKAAHYSNGDYHVVTWGQNLDGNTIDFPKVSDTGVLEIRYKFFKLENGLEKEVAYGILSRKGSTYIDFEGNEQTFVGGCGLPGGAFGRQFFVSPYVGDKRYNGMNNYGMIPCTCEVIVSEEGVEFGTIHELTLTVDGVSGRFDITRIREDSYDMLVYIGTQPPYYDGAVWHWLIPVKHGMAYCTSSDGVNWTHIHTFETAYQPEAEITCIKVSDSLIFAARTAKSTSTADTQIIIGEVDISNLYITYEYRLPCYSSRGLLTKLDNNNFLLLYNPGNHNISSGVLINKSRSFGEQLHFFKWFGFEGKNTWYSTVDGSLVDNMNFTKLVMVGNNGGVASKKGISFVILEFNGSNSMDQLPYSLVT